MNYIGGGNKLDDFVYDKRWKIIFSIINNEENFEAFVEGRVLFHSPTHFVIEYLRVDFRVPSSRRITIIDGRRDSIDAIDDIPEDQIDKRIYPKYRPNDKVSY